jgi:hypothetical protein
MTSETNNAHGDGQRGCNVSSRFNFTVGGLAITAAVVIGYLIAHWW